MEPTASQPLSLRRGPVLGLFHLLIADQGLVLITGEDIHQHWLSAGRHFCQRVGRLIEMPRDVIELETVELVLQLVDFSTIRSHPGIVVASFLHDLVDDQLGVAPDVKLSDTQLDGDA